MTIRHAERITGLVIVKTGDYFWMAHGEIGRTDVRAFNEKDAAQKIVDWNWREVSRIVFQRQDYRCARCGMLRPLQNHHRKHRSAGRIDSIENSEGLCNECHGQDHNPYAYRHAAIA